MKYVGGYGNGAAQLMILGEAPIYNEDLPFSGQAGKELDRLLKDAGINRSECYLTNVCKYEVPANKRGQKPIPFLVRAKLAGIDIQQQLSELQVEINELRTKGNLNCILSLGGTALWALTGKNKISEQRGSIQLGMGVKTVPTYHPAHLLHSVTGGEIKGYWNRQVMIFDFKRAYRQSQFPDLRLPNRVLEVAKNSAHLADFYNRYKDRRKVSVDIEANGTCIPVCIGLAFHKGHGMTVPLWNIDGITIPDSDMVQMWILLAHILINHDVIGQNFNYDRDKIKRLGFTIRRIVSDTMLKAHAINPELPKGLGFNTSIFTEEPFYKDEGMYHGSLNDLLIGCARDACVTYEVDENMDADLDEIGQRDFYENFLMKLPDFYWKMENQGFKVDHTQRDALLRKYIEWDERLRYELFQLVGDEVNVNSPKQVKILLWENFKLPIKETTGEEDITALLNSPTAVKKPEHRRVLELILEDRRVRKSISTYLMALPDYDGRMRTTYFPCLDTGRSSTGQQDPPIRPEVEVVDENGKKKKKVLGTAFQTMTKHGDIGADIRSMYVADEGEIFVQADSSQAEARVVWLLANDEEALRLVDEIDYHAWTASWFFGGTESDYSKKLLGYEHPIRFAGKTLRHAGHLGAGKRRASIELNTQARKYKIPIQISEATADKALKIFHHKQPSIQKIFQGSVIKCLEKNRKLIAPVPYGIESKVGGMRTFFERWGEDLFRQAFSYIPQRAVSDNTKAAGIRIIQRIPEIKVIMEAHDALLFSIPEQRKLEWIPIIKEEMERPIDFTNCSIPRRHLSIPCDVEVGYNYEKLSKFKDLPAPPKKEVIKKERSFYV
jgi:uracil-DNA glycosylase family 4